jgi:hypothetical protein
VTVDLAAIEARMQAVCDDETWDTAATYLDYQDGEAWHDLCDLVAEVRRLRSEVGGAAGRR